MPIVFPLSLPILEDQILFFACQLCSFFKFVNFWGIKLYFPLHANYVPFKLVIFGGSKLSLFFMPIMFPSQKTNSHANCFPFKFCHFLGINFVVLMPIMSPVRDQIFFSCQLCAPFSGSDFLLMPIISLQNCHFFGVHFFFMPIMSPFQIVNSFGIKFSFHANCHTL